MCDGQALATEQLAADVALDLRAEQLAAARGALGRHRHQALRRDLFARVIDEVKAHPAWAHGLRLKCHSSGLKAESVCAGGSAFDIARACGML